MTMTSGFESFGHWVPYERRSRALAHVREMAPEASLEEQTALIDRVCDAIQRDDPYLALRTATWERAAIGLPESSVDFNRTFESPRDNELRLDPIGGYRLLAVLCVDV